MRSATAAPLLIRFLVVGAANTAFGYGVYCLFLYLGAPFPLAGLISLVAGVLVSHHTSATLVFRTDRSDTFLRYLIMWGVVYLLNLASIWALIRIGYDAYLAGLLASVPGVAAAFLLQKLYVFARRGE